MVVKKLIINGNQEYMAEKIIKKDNSIKLINVVDESGEKLGNLIFPSISNMDEFKMEEGQEFDVEIDEIAQLKVIQAEQFETILEFLGGM